jgi:periplasmic protein TonB
MIRLIPPAGVALLIVMGLFLLMQQMMTAPLLEGPQGIEVIESVELVEVTKDRETPEQQLERLAALPPPPPAMPAGLSPDAPTITVPAMTAPPIAASSISVPVALGGGGMTLGAAGNFAGFAGRGTGTGSGSGYGRGQGFKGHELIPLSTARPQMPEWACEKKLRGWVEVVFTVMPNGRVQDVKLVDADPRGVFETAAIESISHWIYAATDKAREVKQRVPMNPEDCAYNWK